MLAASFNVGIDWNYWEEDDDNYVSPRFSDFKSEIMEYKYINNIINVYKKEINKKAREYHQTQLVKSIGYGSNIIPVSYLECIILYTDYSDLSTHFSSTFRPNHKYEPFAVTKKRHSQYYWFAKGIKEMMEVFGQCYYKGIGLLDALRGPFYTGMSFVLTLSQFEITLYGPTSTSIHKEVATRFGGQQGMLITFDNTKGYGQRVKGFDVSWISRYGLQEDERYKIYCL